MFPLGTVVLPGEVLPLRVFEPRYRRLVLDCLAAESGEATFGTALIERGHEVGGGDERTQLATLVQIVRVAPVPGGRFELLANAVARLSVLQWLPDDPYPVADVEPWPDREPLEPEAFMTALATLGERVNAVRALALEAARAGAAGSPPTAEVEAVFQFASDPVRASYQLAGRAPFGPADRFRVLQAPTVEARLDVVRDALDDVEAALRFRLA